MPCMCYVNPRRPLYACLGPPEVSRIKHATGLWSGVAPTRSGRVRRDPLWLGWSEAGVGECFPSLGDAPPTQPGYLELLREVAPGRAQVSGRLDLWTEFQSVFPYHLNVTYGQRLGGDNKPC